MRDKIAGIFHYIRSRFPAEKTQSAGDLGVSLVTVNKIVNDLSERRIQMNAENTAGNIGRKSGH